MQKLLSQVLYKIDVVAMPGTNSAHVALESNAEQKQIPQEIERFMARKFIRIAQALFFVMDAIQPNDHGIIEGASLGQSLLFERFHFVVKAKRSCGGDLLTILVGFDGHRNFLLLDQRVLVHEHRRQFQIVGRFGKAKGEAFVEGTLVTEATFSFAIVDKEAAQG